MFCVQFAWESFSSAPKAWPQAPYATVQFFQTSSQAELAEKIGVSYPRINELVRGKRGVTPDTALRLEQLFGMEAQFWLNLQLAWDLYHVIHSPAVKKIRKIKRLPALAAVASR